MFFVGTNNIYPSLAANGFALHADFLH